MDLEKGFGRGVWEGEEWVEKGKLVEMGQLTCVSVKGNTTSHFKHSRHESYVSPLCISDCDALGKEKGNGDWRNEAEEGSLGRGGMGGVWESSGNGTVNFNCLVC